MSLASGATLPVGFDFGASAFLLGRHFLNESSFWDKHFCWVCNFLFGCQSMRLPSGASLSVGFAISWLGVSLAVGKTFS
jgi:hypothetical protein